ncbi:MAG TPA: hypothetical protein VI072_07435 [Polyangiaceae bacterium]
MASVTPRRRTPAPPFLFLGAGFGTSRKCLECQLCFERVATAEERASIEQLLPPALGYVKSWSERVLNFGSDDALEWHVSGDQDAEPTRQDWTAFCEDFERRMSAVHRIVPIALVLKDDDGTYGRRLSSWHHASLREVAKRFHETSLAEIAPGEELAAVCLSILTMVASSKRARNALTSASRDRLAEWSARVAVSCDRVPGESLVNGVLTVLADEPLQPALIEALFRHPTRQLVARLGSGVLIERARALLRNASSEDAEEVLSTVGAWMDLDVAAALAIGDELLALPAGPIEAAVAQQSRLARRAMAAKELVRTKSPSLTLYRHAQYLMEVGAAERARCCVELATRFPEPVPLVYGAAVRVLGLCGEPERAEALAASQLVQDAGVENSYVYYDVARYYADAGRLPEALEQLRRYVADCPSHASMIAYDPRVAAVRALPEFTALFGPHSSAPAR